MNGNLFKSNYEYLYDGNLLKYQILSIYYNVQDEWDDVQAGVCVVGQIRKYDE